MGGFDCPGYWKGNGSSAPTRDKTKLGAGGYPAGNPGANSGWGGGAGCHFSSPPYGCHDVCTHDIDQVNRQPKNLVGNLHCECNYIFHDDWSHWVGVMGSLKQEMSHGILPEA